MARYPLAQKQKTFAATVVEMVGTQGWQGRLAALWHRTMTEFGDKTESTQKLYISKFRTAVKDAFETLDDGDPRKDLAARVSTYVTFPDGLNESLYAQYQTRIKERSRNLTTVEDYPKIVTLFHDMLSDENIRVKALAVMMLTGRRFYEVMTTADFAPVSQPRPGGKVQHKYLLTFSGQAKTREAEGTKFGVPYHIPCLAPAPEIIATVNAIRNSPEGQRWRAFESTEMNAAESGRMNQMLRGLLAAERIAEPELVKDFTIKQMRALYAEIAYEIFAPKTFSKAAYFSQILGHADDDIKTSLSYMNYVLGRGEENIAKAQREIQAAMEQAKAVEAAYRARMSTDDDDAGEDEDVIEG